MKLTGELAKPLGYRRPSQPSMVIRIGLGGERKLHCFLAAGAGKSGTVARMMDERAKAAAERSEMIDRRLELLLAACGIPKGPDQWKALALRLAEEFIPAFQVIERPGAPLLWSHAALYALRLDVQELMADGHTALGACRLLLKLPDGTWRYPRCRSARSLYRRYLESK